MVWKSRRITGGTGQGLELYNNFKHFKYFNLWSDNSAGYIILYYTFSPQQRVRVLNFLGYLVFRHNTKRKSFVIARGGGTSSFDKYLINSDSWGA
jgi:hypothetical protein